MTATSARRLPGATSAVSVSREPPIADVVATRPLRCIVIGGPGLESFLVEHPRVIFRMLQAMARRLRNSTRR
jgi:CRP-like cAMP-binding protein